MFLPNDNLFNQGSRAFKKYQPWKVDNLRISCDFRQYNSIVMKKKLCMQKCQLQGKFLFRQIVSNFAAFQQNNSISMQKS